MATISKPKFISFLPSSNFGFPKGSHGRTLPVTGIVLHCIPDSISQYDDATCKKSYSTTRSKPKHASLHFVVGQSGEIHQYVDAGDVTWAFTDYIQSSPPPFSGNIIWPGQPTNVLPDQFTINIGLEAYTETALNCFECGPCGTIAKTEAANRSLIHLLAWLAQEYSLPLNTTAFVFHNQIDTFAEDECPCGDMTALLACVAAYCEPCKDQAEILDQGVIDQLRGKTTVLCAGDDTGCEVWEPAASVVQRNETPITVTNNSPFVTVTPNDHHLTVTTDMCAAGSAIPSATLTSIVGVDANGCLKKEDDRTLVDRNETPITVNNNGVFVKVTPGGNDGHDLTVTTSLCDLGNAIQNGTIEKVVGKDANGCIVDEDDRAFVDRNETPWTGTGSNGITVTPGGNDGHDVNFSVDFCVMGQAVPSDTVDGKLLGTNATTGCEVKEDATTVVQRFETDWNGSSPLGSITIGNDGSTPQNGHTPTFDVVAAPTQAGIPNVTSVVNGGVFTPIGAGINPQPTNTVMPNFNPATGVLKNDVRISTPPVGSDTNVLSQFSGATTSDPVNGLYVPRGANANVSGPIVGNASDSTPLDINFSLLDNNDLCAIGNVIPNGVVDKVVGKDSNGCLRGEWQANFVNRNETTFSVIEATDGITASVSGQKNHVLTVGIEVAPAQSGVGNAVQLIPGQGFYVPVAAADKYITGFVISGNVATIIRSDGTTFSQNIPLTIDINVQSFTLNGSNLVLTETDGTVHTIPLPLDTKPVSLSYSTTTGNIVLTMNDGSIVSTTIDLCGTLANWQTGTDGIAGSTYFLGNDCKWHKLPTDTFFVAVSYDPNTKKITLTDNAGNVLDTTIDLCGTLATLNTGADGVGGSSYFLGNDCEWHKLPALDVSTLPTDLTCVNPTTYIGGDNKQHALENILTYSKNVFVEAPLTVHDVASNSSVQFQSITASLTNTHPCKPMITTANIRVGRSNFEMGGNTSNIVAGTRLLSIRAAITGNINSTPILNATGVPGRVSYDPAMVTTTGSAFGFPGDSWPDCQILQPGETLTYTLNLTVDDINTNPGAVSTVGIGRCHIQIFGSTDHD